MVKNQNPSAVRSRAMLRQAMLTLLQQTPYEQITVTALCEQAQLGRKTFYRHYAGRDEVLHEYLNELADGFIAALKPYMHCLMRCLRAPCSLTGSHMRSCFACWTYVGNTALCSRRSTVLWGLSVQDLTQRRNRRTPYSCGIAADMCPVGATRCCATGCAVELLNLSNK